MVDAKRHQVVISGIGLVSPLGPTIQQTWDGLCAGRSGITLHDDPLLKDYPSNSVGRVTDEQELLNAAFDQKKQAKTDRFIHLAMLAGSQALNDAGLTVATPTQRDRFGVCMGVGIGGLKTVSNAGEMLNAKGVRGISPFLIPRTISNMASNWLSMEHNLQGPSFVLTSACSSGGDAIGQAYRMIRDGYADYMLAGGSESCIITVSLIAFGNMRALSRWSGDPAYASRPFEKGRTGFVIAEGAGVVMLERKDLAVKRGADVYAEVVGYGATSDAHHITAMHPDGRGAIAAINQALHEGQIDPSAVGYINAHGTGTPMNDVLETKVIREVFGNHCDKSNADHLLVSSTKSMTGHMIGAAGGAEVAISALALKHSVAPPTINLDQQDEQCDLDYVAHEARPFSKKYALSNSFGFGGSNAVVALKKFG